MFWLNLIIIYGILVEKGLLADRCLLLICRTLFREHIHFFTNFKFLGENSIFHWFPNVDRFSTNILIFKDWTLKKILLQGRGFRGGSDEKVRRMLLGLGIVVSVRNRVSSTRELILNSLFIITNLTLICEFISISLFNMTID